MLHCDIANTATHGSPLNDMLQLSNLARPIVALKQGQHILIYTSDGISIFCVCFLNKILTQQTKASARRALVINGMLWSMAARRTL